ncbi:MAG: hypothetical protein JJU09_08380 [Rhodobacteraceae bacterium]|nr:hypothetical protein [Paracoccaceae bacterium]
MSDKVTYYFIVQPGNLSFRGRFLAATLRENAPAGSRIEAFVPDTDDQLDDNTLRTFAYFNVTLRRFSPRFWPRFDYPIGNKIDVARQPFATDYAVFLDTDIVVTRPFDPACLMQADLSAVPIMGAQVFTGWQADRFTRRAQRWLKVEEFALSDALATARSQCPKPLGTPFPLFNSGVVAFRTGSRFAARWARRTAQVLDAKGLPERMKRPFADQAALGLVAYEMRERFATLDRPWNASFRSGIDDAIFWHYFRIFALFQKKNGRALLLATHCRYTPEGLNLLGEMSEKDVAVFFDNAREFQQARARADQVLPQRSDSA